RPRAQALKSLVAYPFTSFEHSRVVSYTLHHAPPPGTPKAAIERALALLHDFIHVRLIHEGHYSEAITLDRQFSNSPYNTPGGAVSNGLESRRLGVKELLSVLPEVQRKLVDVRLENDEEEARPRGRAPLPANDLTMSWEKLDASTSSLRPPAQPSSLLVPPPLVPRAPLAARSTQQQQYAPLSASQAFRTSQNPRNAVLQAFASSSSDRRNAMEGSPTPTSTPRIGSVLAVRSSPKRAQSVITPPFGMRPPTSGLGRMMHIPQVPLGAAASSPVLNVGAGIAGGSGQPRSFYGEVSAGPYASTAAPQLYPQQQLLPNPFSRPVDSLGPPSVPLPPPATSTGMDVGGSLFRSVKPADVEQSQRIMKKRSFGQVARSPEAASNVRNPFETRSNEGDMSISELQPRAPPPPALDHHHAEDDAGDEGSSDDDELVLNASRRGGRFAAPRVVKSSRMEEPRRDVVEDAAMGDGPGEDEAKEEVGQGSSALPGSFPTGDDDDEDVGASQPARKTRGGKGKAEPAKEQTTSGRSRKAPTPSATTTTATTKKTTSRTTKASASKSTALTRNSTPPTDGEEPRAVRRSSRLSATPSVTGGGGRHASPDRKKARSSAEPEGGPSSAVPATATTTTTRKSGRTSASGGARGKVAAGGRTVSGRTTRGQVQSIVEEE
ncbi:hypothetical protein FRB90_003757, partial [Tulasnella sp. 427]